MAITLFLLFVFLKQFYIFPSGSIGLADISLMLCFLLLLYSRNLDKSLLPTLKQDVLLYLFLGFVIVINSIYGILNQNREFFKYSLFWLYNVCAIWAFRELYNLFGDRFLRQLNHVIKLNIITQLLIYLSGQGRFLHEYWGAIRYMGTFNDPNQLAFFLFLMVLLAYLYACTVKDKTFPIFYLLIIPVLLATKSTGILLGFLSFTGLAILYVLYRIAARYHISKKLLGTAMILAVILFSIFLIKIWPADDFDVKNLDYTMISRIQEKLWKISHGGLIWDRGMEKLVLYPQYLLFGAGEGGFARFTLASQVNEIHCCLFSVLFCYGILPTCILLRWIWNNIKGCPKAALCAVAGLIIESFFLINYRQPMFWMVLIYINSFLHISNADAITASIS